MIPTSDACVPSQKTLAERTCPWKMLTSRGSSKRGELRKGQEKQGGNGSGLSSFLVKKE